MTGPPHDLARLRRARGDTEAPLGDDSVSAPRDVESLGGYILLEELGRGGAGEVRRATRRSDGTEVALKILRREVADDDDMVARFVRERTALVRLDHPNIVRIVDLIVEEGRVGIAMELVHGPSLRSVLQERAALPVDEARDLMGQAASALATVHAAGLIHRDVKPANFLLGATEDGPVLKLSDFGVARFLDVPARTRAGSVIGTDGYIAPELLQKQDVEPTSAVDVYGFGLVAYEILTGSAPFRGNRYAQEHAHREQAPPPLAGVHPDLNDLVMRCLAKDPRARPRAQDVLAALELRGEGASDPLRPLPKPDGRAVPLERARADPATVADDMTERETRVRQRDRAARSLPEPPPEPRPRSGTLWWVSGAAVALLVAAGAFFWFQRGSSSPGPTSTPTPVAVVRPLITGLDRTEPGFATITWVDAPTLDTRYALLQFARPEGGEPGLRERIASQPEPDASSFRFVDTLPGEEACYVVVALHGGQAQPTQDEACVGPGQQR